MTTQKIKPSDFQDLPAKSDEYDMEVLSDLVRDLRFVTPQLHVVFAGRLEALAGKHREIAGLKG